MDLEAYFKSLLLILQLPEFLGPKRLFFLIDVDDQPILNMLSALEIFGKSYICAMTCERFVDNFKVYCFN